MHCSGTNAGLSTAGGGNQATLALLTMYTLEILGKKKSTSGMEKLCVPHHLSKSQLLITYLHPTSLQALSLN